MIIRKFNGVKTKTTVVIKHVHNNRDGTSSEPKYKFIDAVLHYPTPPIGTPEFCREKPYFYRLFGLFFKQHVGVIELKSGISMVGFTVVSGFFPKQKVLTLR